MTRTNSASGALSYEVSRLTQVHATVSYDRVLFDAATAIPKEPLTETEKLLLQGGSAFSSGVSVSRLMSHSDQVGISQQYTTTLNNIGEQSATYTAHATWSRPLAALYSISAEGGFDGYLTPGKSGVSLAPTGAVTVMRRTRAGSIGLGYSRNIEVFGLATHVSSSFNPSYNVVVGRRLNLSLTGRAVKNTYPVDPSLEYSALIGTASVQCTLPGNLIASGNYTYWRRQSLQALTYLNNSSISLSYGKTWR